MKQSPEFRREQPRDEQGTAADMIGTTKDLVDAFSEDDPKVIHCPNCHKAEQSTKFSKAATVFSLGAFVLSAISLGMQFVKDPSDIDAESFKEMMEMLDTMVTPEEDEQAVVPKPSPTLAKPVVAQKSSVAVAVISSVAAVSEAPAVSSTAASKAEAASDGAEADPAATGSR